MTHTRPAQVGTTLPESCLNGELFVNSTAPTGNALYICSSPNTWSAVGLTGASLGGCTVDAASNLTCPGSVFSGTGSLAGMLSLYEIGTNGNTFIGLVAPDLIPASYTLKLPSLPPQSGQVLQFGAPSNGVAEGSWGTASGTTSGTTSGGISPSINTTYSNPAPCSASNAGQLFLIPDGAGIFGQCDGSMMRWFYNHFSVTPPGGKNEWMAKQADTAVANSDGSITISAVNTAAFNSLVKPVTSGTTLTVAYTDELNSVGFIAACYAIATDGAGIWGFGDQVYAGGATYPQISAVTIAPDFSSRTGNPYTALLSNVDNGLKWVRLALGNGKISFQRSSDGVNWLTLPGATASDNSTAFTSIGFGCSTILPNSGVAQMTVYSISVQ